MPELPEVETIATNLRLGTNDHPALIGRTVQQAYLLWERTLDRPGPQEFVSRIRQQTVQAIGRRGKYLIFTLQPDTLLIHLRMSGDLWVETPGSPFAAHHRLVLDFDRGLRLAFNDPRKFGRAWLVREPGEVLGELGPEPLDANFTPEELHRRLATRRRSLKPLLLDQTFLAGVGNIYADEALHLAGLHPLKLSDTIDRAQAERLWQSIRLVLQEGIRRNGASIDWVYRGGDFQNYLRVYQRAGEPCPVCSTPIERIVVGQRGTHICPVCQRQE